MTVQHFADILTQKLSHEFRGHDIDVPRFEPRRGLEAWIGKLARVFSEGEVFHATMQLRHEAPDYRAPDWRLR